MNPGEGFEGDFPYKVLWCLLLTGSRVVEILSFSQFYKVTEDEMKTWRTNPVAPGTDLDRWIKQIGIAKKKDTTAAQLMAQPEDIEKPTHMGGEVVYKPLLGNITSDEFFKVFKGLREQKNKILADAFNETGREYLTKKTVSQYFQTPLRTAFAKEYPRFKLLEKSPHFLRALYGTASWKQFGEGEMSLTLWISERLGHNLNDTATADHYNTVFIVPPLSLTAERVPVAIESALNEARDQAKELRALLAQVQDFLSKQTLLTPNVETPVKPVMLLSKTTKEIAPFFPVVQRGRAERKQEKRDIVEKLRGAGVPVTSSTLRRLGFSAPDVREVLAVVTE